MPRNVKPRNSRQSLTSSAFRGRAWERGPRMRPSLLTRSFAVLHAHRLASPVRLFMEVFVMYLIASSVPLAAADESAKDLEVQAKAFIADAEKTMIPLDVAQARAW